MAVDKQISKKKLKKLASDSLVLFIGYWHFKVF